MSEFHGLEMASAAEILSKPEAVPGLSGIVRIVYDESFFGGFERLEKALNIMAENGWTPRAMAIHGIFFGLLGQVCYVIVEKKESPTRTS